MEIPAVWVYTKMDVIPGYRGAIIPTLTGVIGSTGVVEGGMNMVEKNGLCVADKTFRSLVRNVDDGALREKMFFGHSCFFGPYTNSPECPQSSPRSTYG